MNGAAPGGPWAVERHAGTAAEFHGRELPDPVHRAVWWFEVTQPAVVVGSTQPCETVDLARAAALGVEVVRRRSGGGAVWLAPGEVTWVDVLLPAGDPCWVDDVGRAAGWLGRAWVEALARCGVPGTEVHGAPMARDPDAALVCFGGLAPGEVVLGGAKVVGVSQRRTRRGARFQCAVLHRWDPAPLLDLLALGPVERERLAVRLAGAGAGIGPVAPASLVGALLAVLRTTT